MKQPHVVGLDLSLTSTGIATAGRVTRTARVGQDGVTRLPLADRTRAICDLGRLICFHAHLLPEEAGAGAHFDEYRPDLVMIEAPDVSRSSGGLVERIQLYHEVVRLLVLNQILFGTVTSPVLKGYATGNGGMDKGKKRVLAAVAEQWPEYGKVNNDEADAIVLAAMGRDWLTGQRRVPDGQSASWLHRPSTQWPTGVTPWVA